MMLPVDIKLALDSIRAAKWRSFLTMLGVIIGVAGVMIIVSIGEGVKQQVVNQINSLGTDLITIKPGKILSRDNKGDVAQVNVLETFSRGAAFGDADLSAVRKTTGLGTVVPLSIVSGVATIEGRDYSNGVIMGTTDQLPNMLKQKVLYGGFFGSDDGNRNITVIGYKVAQELFHDNAPIGRAVQIRGETFIVSGVFDIFSTSPLAPGNDYNAAIFIPYDSAKRINDGQVQIQQILVRPQNPTQTAETARAIGDSLRQAHGGQEDFTILQQEDNLLISNTILDLLTVLISGIAAISLIVGGVGIMNIMLVSVSERTHEIGIRKSIGATNHQISRQFLVEASVLSLIGGFIGVLIALIADYFIRLLTNLTPVLTFQTAAIAISVALAVGIFFGVAPALKAANKDPIEALRQG